MFLALVIARLLAHSLDNEYLIPKIVESLNNVREIIGAIKNLN